MRNTGKRFAAGIAAVTLCCSSGAYASVPAGAAYGVGGNGTAIMEYLDRGIYAVRSGSGMLVSWRFNANDADDAEFQLFRDDQLIYTSKAGDPTCYYDASGSASSRYRVDTVQNGTAVSSDGCRFTSGSNYFDIPLDVPAGGVINGEAYSYSPNDTCCGASPYLAATTMSHDGAVPRTNTSPALPSCGVSVAMRLPPCVKTSGFITACPLRPCGS